MASSEPTVLAGRYELMDRIGAGGMATVWRALDLNLNRQVAIKLVHEHLVGDAEVLERFRLEAQFAAALSHPNIVSIYDWVTTSSEQFLVMELVEGESLRERLRRTTRLSVPSTLSIGDQVLAGLSQAHERGVVHRDIKPENVLIAKLANGAEIVKVADFGIAKSLTDRANLTQLGIVGTPAYVAPELLAGGVASPASDVYAVGCVLYECLAGVPAFTGEPMAVALQHQKAKVPFVGKERPDVTPAVDGLLQRAMDKDPRRRFIAAGPMQSAIHQLDEFRGQASYGSAEHQPDQHTRIEGDGSGPSSSKPRVLMALCVVALAICVIAVISWVALHGQHSSTVSSSATSVQVLIGPHPAVTRVAYQDANDNIRWFDTTTDKTFAVPGGANPDPTNSRVSNAFFRSPNLLSFIANPGGAQANSIQQTHLLTGVVSTVVSSTTQIFDAQWNPNGTELAYIQSGSTDQVKIFDAAQGTTSTPLDMGSDVNSSRNYPTDNTAVIWSLDGSKLAVVDTDVIPPAHASLWVITPHGGLIGSPLDGTFPVWSKNSQDLYFRPFSAGSQWFDLSVADGTESPLPGLRADATGITLSPNGTELAYSDQSADQAVFTYNLATHQQREVATGLTMPIWVSNLAVLAVKTSPCTGPNCPNPWNWVGPGTMLNIQTGRTAPTAITEMDSSQQISLWPN